jgi:uncharacterized pyridoxal phosphate-containing UPF0001 family protein
LGKKLQVLIQVNIDNEDSKSGTSVKDLPSLVESVKKLKNIELIGLMCIPQKNKNTAFAKMLELKKPI